MGHGVVLFVRILTPLVGGFLRYTDTDGKMILFVYWLEGVDLVAQLDENASLLRYFV
jgi:hypothetical protein